MSFSPARRSLIRVVSSSALALAPLFASAVDGVVLLDQNKALAGSVTPGDAPGFPITITQPGSYRLGGNITVPNGRDGIIITVPNVTLDLNGFALLGDPSSYGAAISYTGPLPGTGLAVRNGVINGFISPLNLGSTPANGGFSLVNGAEVMLKDLYINLGLAGTSTGFTIGGHSTVSHVVAGAYDLYVTTCPSTVVDSVFRSVRTGPPSTRCMTANTATDF